jgi:hypothetical protein
LSTFLIGKGSKVTLSMWQPAPTDGKPSVTTVRYMGSRCHFVTGRAKSSKITVDLERLRFAITMVEIDKCLRHAVPNQCQVR